MSDPAPRRIGERRLWLLVLVAASLGMVVSVAFATGLVGDSKGHRQAVVAAPKRPPGSAPPSPSRAVLPVHPRVTPMVRSVPTRLRIPAIGVDSPLMALGLKGDGTLETPPAGFPAGWYTGAPTPGQLGPAIIVGHVRYNTPGVFAHLTDLRRDDEIFVGRRDRTTARFRIVKVQHFAKSAFPTAKVYGDIDHPGLRLITCGGLDASTNEFDENVVVFAEMINA